MTLAEYMVLECDKIKALFAEKAAQYATTDELDNFTRGGELLFGKDMRWRDKQFEAAKAYMAKHVAFIYGHKVSDIKVPESLGDIATYALIMKYMAEGGQSQ